MTLVSLCSTKMRCCRLFFAPRTREDGAEAANLTFEGQGVPSFEPFVKTGSAEIYHERSTVILLKHF